jgi:hypothetical protein
MTIIWKLQYWQKFEDLYVKKSTLKTDYDKVQKLIWKRYELFLDLLNKIQELSYDFCIFWYFSEMFLDRKSHGSVYGSQDHDCLSIHGGLTTMERCGRSGAREVIVIAQRERERVEVIGVLTNDVTWRRSCRDGHTMALNRGGRWCFDREMVPGARRRNWSRGGCAG